MDVCSITEEKVPSSLVGLYPEVVLLTSLLACDPRFCSMHAKPFQTLQAALQKRYMGNQQSFDELQLKITDCASYLLHLFLILVIMATKMI